MSAVGLPEPYELQAWDRSDQSWELGAVIDEDGAAIDCSTGTTRALIKRHSADDDDDAAATLTVTWGGAGNNVPTIALADDAGLEAGASYQWSVLVQLGTAIYTVAHGTLLVHAQATASIA